MQYMLLIYNAEGQKMNPEEQGKLFQEYMAFTQGIVKAGKFKAGEFKWLPGGYTHTLTNVSKSPARFATVEF